MTCINIYAHALLLNDNGLRITIWVLKGVPHSKTRGPTKVPGHPQGVIPAPLQAGDPLLCTPASSVPRERLFSKAGEVVCQRRNRLKPSTIEKNPDIK